MGVTVVTPPADEPVSTAELKLHLKIDTSLDDSLIATLGKAARGHVEAYTRRQMLSATYDDKRPGFPSDGGPMVLQFPPVSSITSVSYVDMNGDTQVWTAGATGYRTELPAGELAEPARIYPAYGVVYPVTRCQPDAVTIRYVAGYGDDADDVPGALLAAIKHLVEHWYVNRGVIDGGINSVTSKVPMGVEAMLGPFKLGWA